MKRRTKVASPKSSRKSTPALIKTKAKKPEIEEISSLNSLTISIKDDSEKTRETLSKIIELDEIIDGIYYYQIKSPDTKSYNHIFRKFAEIPSIASFESPSGRQIQIPVNLFGTMSKISGPVCLQTVRVDGRIYHFFGDVHESLDGMCSPDSSRVLEEIVKSFADLRDGPSLDVFTEISRSKLPSSIGPLSNFIKSLYQCMSGKDTYTAKNIELCGLNSRYHWSDIRKHVPEACLIKFQDSINLTTLTIEQVDISLRSTISILEGLLKTSYLIQDYLVDDDRHQRYLRYLERYDHDEEFRHENNLLTLDILSLPPSFISAFVTGKVAPGEYHNFASIIYKQIEACDPQIVEKVFRYISNCIPRSMLYTGFKAPDIFSELEENIRMRKTALLDPQTILLAKKEEVEFKESQYKNFYKAVISVLKTPERVPAFVDKLSKDSIPIYSQYSKDLLHSDVNRTEVFNKVIRVMASTFTDRKFNFVPYYSMFMDLFTLLRIERDYSKPRVMEDPSGNVLSTSEYYSRRPLKAENIVVYVGAYHSINYAQYFTDRRGGEMIFEYPSRTQRQGMGLISYISGIRHTADFRCVNLGAPLSTLFIPRVSLDEIVVESDFPLK